MSLYPAPVQILLDAMLAFATSRAAVNLADCRFPICIFVCLCCRYSKKTESKKEDEDTKEEVEADED